MTRTTRCLPQGLVAMAVVLIASAAVDGQPTDASLVEIQVGDNMRFAPPVVHTHPGERVRVVLKGVGKIPKNGMAHNFVLLKSGADPKAFVEKSSQARETDFVAPALKDRVIAATQLVGPNESVEITFEAPEQPGEYTFVCAFPGHFKLGMKGQLIVK